MNSTSVLSIQTSSSSKPTHSQSNATTTTSSSSSAYRYGININPALISIDHGNGSNGSSRLIIKSRNLDSLLPTYTLLPSKKEKCLDSTAISDEHTDRVSHSPCSSRRSSISEFSVSSSSFSSSSFSPSSSISLYYSLEEEEVAEGEEGLGELEIEEIEFEGRTTTTRSRDSIEMKTEIRSTRRSARIFILPAYSTVDKFRGTKEMNMARRVGANLKNRERSGSNKSSMLGKVLGFLTAPSRID